MRRHAIDSETANLIGDESSRVTTHGSQLHASLLQGPFPLFEETPLLENLEMIN